MVVKFLIFLLIFLGRISMPEMAEDVSANPSSELELVTPKNVDFSKCVRNFDFPVEKLFYLSILAINANHFEIEELQSKMGYILFRAAGKSFLMSVAKVDAEHSMLKITPADNVYFFPYGVVYNIYKYIELNADEQLQELNITSQP